MGRQKSNSFRFVTTAAFIVAVFFCAPRANAKRAKPKPTATPAPAKSSDGQLENYQDLIQKAQNLTLQQDRLQTSQVLIRGIQREARTSTAYKELTRALDELTSVFYTEKAQSLFATAEAMIETRPRDAIEQLQEALKTDDRNMTILNELARVHLRMDECDKADQRVKQAEEVNPYSPEVKLLRIQVLSCQKNYELLATKLSTHEADLDALDKFVRGIQVQDLIRRKDFKKAKSLLGTWETQAPDYPEVYYWNWELSHENGDVDRLSAAKYLQLCQNLTPRKLQSLKFDVDLCKQKLVVDKFLKDSASTTPTPAPTSAEGHR